MFTLNPKSRSRWMLLLLLLVAGVTNTLAQNVTIKATNGSMIASMAKTGWGTVEDLGYKSGGFATWQHEQLSMVLTTSDHTDLTNSGQLDNPANNLYAADGHIQICKGSGLGYVSLSLPKGFRFTGYTITFSKPDALTKGQGSGNTVDFNQTDVSSTFGETVSPTGRYITQATVSRAGASGTISRTEMSAGDMSNVLYFRLGPESQSFEIITLESAEFFFTSEENYTPVVPTGDFTDQSAVDIPFSTSKVDYGRISQTTYYGNSRITYTSANVKDVDAYFTLYEDSSIVDGTNFDGTTGKVVEYKAGSISSAGSYFKLGKKGYEKKYFLETPTYVEMPNDGNVKNPVGYRIVNAKFDYATQAGSDRTFYIRYSYDGDWYYLYTNGNSVSWETSRNRRTLWTMDTDGYIKSTSGYYLVFNQTYAGVQTNKPGESERYVVGEDGIYQFGWPDYYIRFYREPYQNYWGQTRYRNVALVSKDYGDNADYYQIDPQVDPISGYKLKIYDAAGANPHEITVTGDGSYTLENLNNDAVKFGVEGIGLVKVTLTLQALDPFLDHMKVVCNDSQIEAIKMKQDFTASDFSVSGGEFYFHVPETTDSVYITFEDLVSKYFDETYDGGKATCTSRINFVQSEHNQEFGTWESKNNNIYNNTAEAAAGKETIKERLKVGVVGTKKFKFNNADEVGASGGTLTEYPFTFAKYAASPNKGDFGSLGFNVSDEDQVDTCYVFTTDETRYNIAPTNAVQHRAYAFYQMIVHVQSATYTPKVRFTKIYDKTLYRDSKNKVKTDAFYGVEVTAPVEDGSDEQGYAATDKIFNAIDSILTKSHKDDFDNSVPEGTTAKQIIYLDFSKLAGVYEITTQQHQSMDDYSNTNAANCLIFLPKGASAPNNNVAYQLESGGFQAANDIVLTDMQPFYTPYDIQVAGANKVEYKRLITKSTYGQEKTCTVILPFNILVENGKHKNLDGSEFTLHKMQATNSLVLKDGTTYAYMPNAFGDVTETTEQNKPFIVKLANVYSVDTLSFVVTQNGATIKATAGIMNSNYTISDKDAEGEVITSSGTATDGDAKGKYTFTNKGTYAGIEIGKDEEVFYFARNNFVCSKNLDTNISTAKVAPFRTFYATQAGGAAKLMSFDMIFSEGLGDTPTGINSLGMNPDLKVVPGNGMITLTSTIEQNVRVNSTSGVLTNNAKMQAGETRTINVPAGVYVINGVKIIVK